MLCLDVRSAGRLLQQLRHQRAQAFGIRLDLDAHDMPRQFEGQIRHQRRHVVLARPQRRVELAPGLLQRLDRRCCQGLAVSACAAA